MDLKQCNKGNLTAHMTQIPAVYQNQQTGEAPPSSSKWKHEKHNLQSWNHVVCQGAPEPIDMQPCTGEKNEQELLERNKI